MRFNLSWFLFIPMYIVCSALFGFFAPKEYYPIIIAENLISIEMIESFKLFYILFLESDFNMIIMPVKILVAGFLLNGSIQILKNNINLILVSFFITAPIILYFLNLYLISHDYVFFYVSGIIILFSYIFGFAIGQTLYTKIENNRLDYVDFLCSFSSIVALYYLGVDEFQSTQLPVLFCMLFVGILLSCFLPLLSKKKKINKENKNGLIEAE